MIPVYYVALSPFPFTSLDFQMIKDKISEMRKEGKIRKVKEEPHAGTYDCSFRYFLKKTGIDDVAYRLTPRRRRAAEQAPATIEFILRAAQHSVSESFHITIQPEGCYKIIWNVPRVWESIWAEETRRFVERIVAEVIWGSFEKMNFSHNLFHHPSHHLQGFAFRRLNKAFLFAIKRLDQKYSNFILRYRTVRNWKNLYLLEKHVEALSNRINIIGDSFNFDSETKNIALAVLSQLRHKLQLELAECVINDVILWELSDTL